MHIFILDIGVFITVKDLHTCGNALLWIALQLSINKMYGEVRRKMANCDKI
jgi:hypothetical protein